MTDEEREYYDSVLGSDIIEPEEVGTVRYYVGTDTAVVERGRGTTHWSELPTPVYVFPSREYGDNDPSDPEQNWDEE